jgi:2-polyprenyl-3-methyl-5-hydroxy-6-metoxy-1,4-benzoquinol methylase
MVSEGVMAKIDKEKWDARYLENIGEMDPTPLLDQYWHLAAIGNALDIACGNGRNSLFLANRGFFVDVVDISENHLVRREKGGTWSKV